MKAILFDLDGTLIDTKELILTSFRRAAEDVLGAAFPDERVQALIGIPLIEQARALAPDHVDGLMAAYRTRNLELHDELIHYFEGTREMLEAFAEEGRRMAVVTSKRNQPAQEGLASFDLQGYFEFVSGLEETDKHKPDPEPLLVAAARMGVPIQDCVYVGDSPYDMRAALAAGSAAVAALWGMYTREELLDAGAEYEAAAPSELPGLIRRIDTA
ncbi:MAG: HAD-IA family hydrolase [Coriobacteriia bacterium]|nr:HAD-IA family hydrolase [Coriobacteriia bacterium]